MDNIVMGEPKVTITFGARGVNINVGQGIGADQLLIASGLLQRAAGQMLDMMEMQQQQASMMAQQIMKEKR